MRFFFPIYQLFVPHFPLAVLCVYRINKQRDRPFEFSSILSTVDLSKYLIMVESFEIYTACQFCDLQVFFSFFGNRVWLNLHEWVFSGNETSVDM